MAWCEFDDNLWVTDSDSIVPLPGVDPDTLGDAMSRLLLAIAENETSAKTMWRRSPRGMKRMALAAVVDGQDPVTVLEWMFTGTAFYVKDESLPKVPLVSPPLGSDVDNYMEGSEQ